ncbi:DUF1620-domain-containing protein [Rhodocollybia butyracea]|uniref:ER membrane protein complex subunit 1 n=1 Tax=Rhodocollybia butyracea TaxID=206335 RepID=A0A9P5Q5K0_9AGAR|nr:DUF1620-domain-containing protein [Rhodocollybia butyracea]
MRLHAIPVSLLTLWVTCSVALHESDAGVVDWHKRLIGVPNTESRHTSPVFHRAVEQKSKQSIVLTATRSNVMAAVDPLDGSVLWRYVYEPEDNIVTFQQQGSVVASLSGTGGATLRTFNMLSGEPLIEKRLHEPETGLLIQPNNLGTFIAFGNKSHEIYTLTNGRIVNCFHNGEILWTWRAQDHSSQILYSTIQTTDDAVYVVGLASSFASYVLHVVALSPLTGEVLASASVPSTISNGLDEFLVLSDMVVWIEKSSIKSFALSPSLSGRSRTLPAASYEKLVNIGLGSHGMFIAVGTNGFGQLIACEDGNLVTSKNFERPSTPESFYAGGLDMHRNPYVSHVHVSTTTKFTAVEIFSPHLQGLLAEYILPWDMNTHGTITYVAMDVVNSDPDIILGRLLLTTSTGSVQIWQRESHLWTREEGLAELNAAKFVELPERVSGLTGEGRSEEGFVGRLVRQIKDVKDLPSYLVRFSKRFATGSYESATSSASVLPSPSVPQLPFRDAFGFRQVLVASTTYGKVYGIDTSNGDILWNRVLGVGSKAHERGAKVTPIPDKLFVTKTVGDVDGDTLKAGPEIVLLAKITSEESASEDILLFHLNALTGQDAVKVLAVDGPLEGLFVTSRPIQNVYMLQSDEIKVIVLLDSDLKVYLYPDDTVSKNMFAKAATTLTVPLTQVSQEGQRKLIGHQFGSKSYTEDEMEHSAFPTWTLSLPDGQDVQSLITPIRDPVASIGKVLGNRTTLYKYLNPHMVLVLTAPHSSSALNPNAHCGLYLLDSVKGSIVYQVALPIGRKTCNVKAAFTENWLVYHYYDDEHQGPGQTKGYKMVTVELYEGKEVDDKTRSSEISSYSDKMLDLTAYEQSFVYPHAISAIALTSTKFGITSKDIIVANVNGKIQSFSRRLVNPRRPVGRKPNSEETEEFLVQYDPLLPDDSRKVFSHNYDVAHARFITTSPALLESTSLVFVYGLDLFLSRVAPSNTFDVLNESFNKVQLVLTVIGLLGAIFVTRPMVTRKKLREKWYQ